MPARPSKSAKQSRNTGDAAAKALLFIGTGEDARFAVQQGPWAGLKDTQHGRAVVIVPPFCEEMNRCRRLVSLMQTALMQQEVPSFSFDFYGTGDSAGSFSNARLQIWRDDLKRAVEHACALGANDVTLMGIRFGAAMALECAHSLPAVKHIVAIAPQTPANRAMREFIRIATIAPDFNDTPAPNKRVLSIPARLEAGEVIEVGGYQLSPDLYRDFQEELSAEKAKADVSCIFVTRERPNTEPMMNNERNLAQAIRRQTDGQVQLYRVNDAPVWYQGTPEEPQSLPDIAAQIASQPEAQTLPLLQEAN